MIVDETYLPAFRQRRGSVEFVAAASRTGRRGEKLLGEWPTLVNFAGPDAVQRMLATGVDAVCVATPDDRHFEPARLALEAGKHVLIEKPSVLSLAELDELAALAARNGVLAKVVYHKLLDPDHKKLRTHVVDGVLRHVNNGYCSLLEPKSISGGQFAEWVTGRNPATYVAVHYLKLIDFTFGPDWRLSRVSATGQRGLVGPADGPTWDSVQTQVVYTHPDGREAAFDIHTSWVTPDDFPGYVEQEVQFRFDNGVWNAHQRKRGVEVCVEGRGLKTTPNHHYNGSFLEPWGERSQRGYGVEAVTRFFDEVARGESAAYNDLAADRNVVAAVQAVEAILAAHAAGRPGSVVRVNGPGGGLVQWFPGERDPVGLYSGRV
jgi:predicted dehydrogenase